MILTEYFFVYDLKPLEKSMYRAVFYYLKFKSLDLGNKKSVKLACDNLNLTPKRLTELIEDFERDGLVSFGDGFPKIDVTLTKAGLAFISKYCR